MTVPAYAGADGEPHRPFSPSRPTSTTGRDLASAVLVASTRDDLPDSAFRFYALVVAYFSGGAFTGPQAANVAGVSVKTAWQHLGTLAGLELLTSRRVVVGENEHGRPVRQRIYRVAAVNL